MATPTEKLRAIWVNSGEVDRATWAERAYDALHLARRLEESHARTKAALRNLMVSYKRLHDSHAIGAISEGAWHDAKAALEQAEELK